MTFSVVWSPEAANDFENIVTYLQTESLKAAGQIAENILVACDKLESFPLRGRRLPEMIDVSGQDVREIIVTPWRVIYEIHEQAINILMIIDGRRDMQSQLVNLSLRRHKRN